MRRWVLLVALLHPACAPAPTESVALADRPKEGVHAKPVDLEALAAQRAASGGAELEGQLAAERSADATKAFVNRPGEATVEEVGAAAAPAGAGSLGYDLARDAAAGSSAPSDLDREDADAPAVDAPWINMQVVEERILEKSKAMKACWDTEGPGGVGRVDMAVTVGPDGRARSVSVAPSSPHRGGAAECIARALRSIRYPEPRGGDASFVYPVKF